MIASLAKASKFGVNKSLFSCNTASNVDAVIRPYFNGFDGMWSSRLWYSRHICFSNDSKRSSSPRSDTDISDIFAYIAPQRLILAETLDALALSVSDCKY